MTAGLRVPPPVKQQQGLSRLSTATRTLAEQGCAGSLGPLEGKIED